MAAELDKLAKEFKARGDKDIAQGISAWAQVARARGRETFSLPEGILPLPDLTIGGKTAEELEKMLTSNGHRISDYAMDLLKSPDFTTLPDEQTISLVRITVSGMGLKGNPTIDQIYKKADELGLDLCPAETGPYLRLAYKDQPMNEWLSIGMKQIADRNGRPDVFSVERRAGGSWLRADWAEPTRRWRPGGQLVFSPRK